MFKTQITALRKIFFKRSVPIYTKYFSGTAESDAAAPAGSGSWEKVGFAEDVRIFLKKHHLQQPFLMSTSVFFSLL